MHLCATQVLQGTRRISCAYGQAMQQACSPAFLVGAVPEALDHSHPWLGQAVPHCPPLWHLPWYYEIASSMKSCRSGCPSPLTDAV